MACDANGQLLVSQSSTPTTFSARTKTAGNAPVFINGGGHLSSFTLVNTSSTINAYVKLYDGVVPPDPLLDIPFMIYYINNQHFNARWIECIIHLSGINTL